MALSSDLPLPNKLNSSMNILRRVLLYLGIYSRIFYKFRKQFSVNLMPFESK
jgi:hypothetical protein